MQRLIDQILLVASADEDARRRGRVVIILSLIMVIVAALSTPLILMRPNRILPAIIVVGGILIMLAAIVFTRRGAVLVGGLLLVSAVTGPTLASLAFDRSQPTTMFFLALPVVIAGLVLRPAYIWLAFGIVIAGLFGVSFSAPALLASYTYQLILSSSSFFILVIAALVFVGGWVTETAIKHMRIAQATAETSTNALLATNAALDDRVTARTADLATALHEVERRAAAQEELIRENEYQRVIIRELSVPVLPISATTLVMPLIGALDSSRLNDLQQQALNAIEQYRARRLLLDITGVPVVDSQVAQGLIRVVEAARLLGAEVVLVGIRPEVAQAVVGLGINLAGMRSYSDLRSALAA